MTAPFTLYFAGLWGGTEKDQEHPPEILAMKNRLVSYYYKEQLKEVMSINFEGPTKIIIDSGAFSAWNTGSSINFSEYIQYCHEAIAQAEKANRPIRVVNLDVIPGQKGQTAALLRNRKHENKDLIEQAAQAGFNNLKAMKAEGVCPIHVFHQGEAWSWIDKIAEETDYMGVSPANDMPVKTRVVWMNHVFDYMERRNIKVKTHGFATLFHSALRDLPLTSADALSWKMVPVNGQVLYPVGGFKNPDYSQRALVIQLGTIPSDTRGKWVLGHLSQAEVALLKEDGYDDVAALQKDWRLRARICIRYYLGLEAWVNALRAARVPQKRISSPLLRFE